MHVRHPYNPDRTDIYLHPISQATGLERQVVSLARLPPGNESFLPHAHTFQEEFVFILEGEGEAILGDDRHRVGPGDFVGYPCDGVAHQLRNTGDVDLIYLMGGERTPFDLVRFPTIDKIGLFTKDGVKMFGTDEGRQLDFSDYLVNK